MRIRSVPPDTKIGTQKGVAYATPNKIPIQYITPNTQLVTTPYKITGPAMVKILQPTPNT